MLQKYQITKYDYLDQLRWIAILGVVFTHLHYLNLSFWTNSIVDKIFSIGWMWVPLFFILSAYTLSLSHASRSRKEKNIFTNFYIRRFFRIYPLFLFICTGVFILFSSLILFYNLEFNFDTGIKNWIFHASFLFGFFPEYIGSMYLWEWSLFNELVFYLLFPFIFFIIKKRTRLISLLILWLLLLSYGANVYTQTYGGPDLYGTPITHLYSFMLGMWLFKIKNIQVKKYILRYLSYLNIVTFIILTYLYFIYGYLHIYIPFILNLTLFTFLFIKGYYCFNNKILAEWFKFNGIISYSLYLINYWFYILSGIFFHKIILNLAEQSLLLEVSYFVMIVIYLYLLSYLSYKFIELRWIRVWKSFIEKYSK